MLVIFIFNKVFSKLVTGVIHLLFIRKDFKFLWWLNMFSVLPDLILIFNCSFVSILNTLLVFASFEVIKWAFFTFWWTNFVVKSFSVKSNTASIKVRGLIGIGLYSVRCILIQIYLLCASMHYFVSFVLLHDLLIIDFP